MKRVIIESPYAGNISRNTEYARRCLRDSLDRGEAPLASHLLYPQVLDENKGAERAQGIDAGFEWMAHAELVAFYDDYGRTGGMQEAIDHAFNNLHIPVVVRTIGKNPGDADG